MFILVLILIILLSVIYLVFKNNYENDNMIYIRSNIDGNKYWVRNLPDKQNSANTLAKIRKNIVKLVDYLKKNSDKFPKKLSYIKDLIKRTKVINIMETPKDDKFTSYTVNKGEKIVFCLRHKVINTIHDMNTLMYVVIHELAHVGCPEYGHTPLFKKIFKFLLKQSVKIGIYVAVDYTVLPQNYCGMVINEYLFDK
jgi:predicted metal-dependent hydrolase